jgi:hypothetical protein
VLSNLLVLFAAAGLAFLAGVLVWVYPQDSPHLLIEVAWIALSTFIGAYAAFRLQTRREDAKAVATRAVLATTLLVELRWLNSILRQAAISGVPAGDPFAHPVLEAALREPELFDHPAAVALAHFRSLLLDVQNDARAAQAPRNPDDALAFRREQLLRASVKAKATYAANALADVKDALLRSGGTLPPAIQEEPATLDAPPPLLPSPFELFEAPGPGSPTSAPREPGSR